MEQSKTQATEHGGFHLDSIPILYHTIDEAMDHIRKELERFESETPSDCTNKILFVYVTGDRSTTSK